MILATMVLSWSVLTCSEGQTRTFKFERATLPLTLTRPEPPLVWLPFDSYDAAGCTSRTARGGCTLMTCTRPDPDRFSAFRVAACNGFSCTATATTARLSCVAGVGMAGCPCTKLAAPAGCVP